MGSMQNLSRRAFLFGSAAVAGGIAFGSYSEANQADLASHGNPLTADLGPNSVSFNPWVEISPDKITLIAQHADIGQGVGSVQPIMIAEEMDLDPGQFEIRFAGPSPAYFNTGFADELAPFMAADQSPAAEKARAAALECPEKIRPADDRRLQHGPGHLRKAARGRRCGARDAQGRGGQACRRRCRRCSHRVRPRDPAGRQRKFPTSSFPPTPRRFRRLLDAKLRDPSQWRILGKPMTRLDVRSKAMGELKFGIDLKMDGMVYASVKLNPDKGQPMKSYDASKARSMPGVKKILEIKNGIAVIATNSWYAMKAVEAIDCTWAPSAYPAEQADHWKKLDASFKPQFLGKEWRKIGDIDAGLKDGTPVKAEYRAPYVAHQPLEPLNGVAIASDKGLEIWVGHQSPQAVQSIAAAAIGIKPEQVIFHNQWVGGSFGHRLEFENVRVLAEIANQMRGTPIKLIFSREEDFLQDIPRQISVGRYTGSVKKGKIVAADFRLAATAPFKGLLERMGSPIEGSGSPARRRDVEYVLRHPEFPGHQL